MIAPVEEALEVIGLSGSEGLALNELWPALSLAGTDEHVCSFVWAQLYVHPELKFSRAAPEGGATPPTGGIAVAAPEPTGPHAGQADIVVGSEQLRLWALGLSSASWSSLGQHQQQCLETIGRAGRHGLHQANLSKLTDTAPNKLFYSLKVCWLGHLKLPLTHTPQPVTIATLSRC